MSESVAQLEARRTALTGHCYRMLGSSVDADDATQETIIRARKSLDRFDGRASLRTWLYKIATNVCLDELADRGRRARPMEEGPRARRTSRPRSLSSGQALTGLSRSPMPAGGHKPWAVIVLELSGDRIAGLNSFLDTETLFPKFDLPMELPA